MSRRIAGHRITASRVRNRRLGFTLVELLVVIAIIGVLVGLLLPAVNAAREAGRRATCMNNLKQLGLASQNFLSAFKRYPSGGWGPRWIGDPDAGNTIKQPGGWVYNLLPYVEQDALHDYGNAASASSGNASTIKQSALDKLMTIPLGFMNCPSRRVAASFTMTTNLPYDPTSSSGGTLTPVGPVAHGDYAANVGVRKNINATTGTTTDDINGVLLAAAEQPTTEPPASSFSWPSCTWSGVIFQRSAISDVKDGTSHTYLFGEKWVDRAHYDDGLSPGDQGSVYAGMGNDNYRWTYVQPTSTTVDPTTGAAKDDPGNQVNPGYPTMLNDTSIAATSPSNDPNNVFQACFGSAHAGIVNFAMCDGSTIGISTSIDALTHRYLGERNDHRILDDSVIGR